VYPLYQPKEQSARMGYISRNHGGNAQYQTGQKVYL
jgi:hypothetical protein